MSTNSNTGAVNLGDRKVTSNSSDASTLMHIAPQYVNITTDWDFASPFFAEFSDQIARSAVMVERSRLPLTSDVSALQTTIAAEARLQLALVTVVNAVRLPFVVEIDGLMPAINKAAALLRSTGAPLGKSNGSFRLTEATWEKVGTALDTLAPGTGGKAGASASARTGVIDVQVVQDMVTAFNRRIPPAALTDGKTFTTQGDGSAGVLGARVLTNAELSSCVPAGITYGAPAVRATANLTNFEYALVVALSLKSDAGMSAMDGANILMAPSGSLGALVF